MDPNVVLMLDSTKIPLSACATKIWNDDELSVKVIISSSTDVKRVTTPTTSLLASFVIPTTLSP
jgi:hypothetical protein